MTRLLAGRSALITGANQGLGLAIAQAYVEAGANVFLCARNADRLTVAHTALTAIAGAGQIVAAHPLDVANWAEVEQVVSLALARLGRIHILVNNAGVYGPKGLIEEVDWDAWTQAIDINLYGSILMCRALLPHFKTHGYGKIVQLSGGGATNPLPRLSAYAASKAAIVRFAGDRAAIQRASSGPSACPE